jgi:glycerol kinase
MSDEPLIGAIDQGTTGTRFMAFGTDGTPRARAYREHRQIFPRPGWVEHNAEEIWQSTCAVVAEALSAGGIAPERIAAVGVSNQRETTVVWDASTGRCVHNAIVWQDRRTAPRIREIEREGRGADIRERTGLKPDPYFSATKLEWLLQNVAGLRERAERGEALAGTVDTWLIWKLTGAHVTDPTNASRTMLFNLRTMDWDEELLALFGVPRAMLPEVRPSSALYGECDLGRVAGGASARVPVAGDLGDQQAALFGQACFAPGDTKNTYGTGSFLLRNTGETPVESRHGLLTTVAYHLPGAPPRYALEGSVFITGAAVQWLRDGLGVIAAAPETGKLARSVPDTGGVYFVPAFAGLGAPYWEPDARGTIVGLTRGTGVAHLARATLEAIAYQTRDVVEAMAADAEAVGLAECLKVDGGAAANDFLCQFQSDLLGLPVVRPVVRETTALGAAYAAGLAAGCWKDLHEIRALWRAERTFEPAADRRLTESLYGGWKAAVRAALRWAEQAPPSR